MPNRLVDLSGRKFGRWTVASYAGKKAWLCRCSCGAEKPVLGAQLKNGSSTSCGCNRRKKQLASAAYNYVKHKHEYRSWGAMKNRCLNKNNKDFIRYGAKGIGVCDAWLSFDRFFADMGPAPTPEHQIDRIENDLGYFKSNCRWATPAQNSRNRRKSTKITHNGVTKTAAEWSYGLGLNRHAVLARIRGGWSVEAAITKRRTPRKLRRTISATATEQAETSLAP